ncbi:unnamed protein product [Prunus brigantina]
MSDMEEVLERQEREIRERRRRRATSKRAQRDLDQQLVMAVAMLDEENQSSRGSHEGRALNVDEIARMGNRNSVHQGLPAPTHAQGPATTSVESRTERISRNDW